MMRHLIVAYDGTSAAERAFLEALELARSGNWQVHAVAVAWSAEVETRVGLDQERNHCWERLQPLRARGEALHVPIDLEVRESNAASSVAEQIVASAQQVHADLIVIGHRRRSLVRRLAEASVAKRVIDRARCSVLVAP